MDTLTQPDPWHASPVRSTHATSLTSQRPGADISTPFGGSTVARMLGSPLGSVGMAQTSMPSAFPGADTKKDTQEKRGSWWQDQDTNVIVNR